MNKRDNNMIFKQPSQTLHKVQEFAIGFLEKRLPANLYFHSFSHTLEVVEAALEIGTQTGLTSDEIDTVCIAAWFHDVGYCNTYKDHETESAVIAEYVLGEMGLAADKLNNIISCIVATRYPQQPVSLLEKVICDADFYHFSRKDYHAHEQALRREWELHLNLFYTDQEWNSINLQMLSSHHYFTDYGQKVLQLGKEENIKKLQLALN
jgi:predicted metal-dependent HD superfamily phosphohydrolase